MTKRIVLFSDGTGNSSAKVQKTNVWRLFQALDQTQPDQLARYDNGVGTSSSKYLAALGARSVGGSSATFWIFISSCA